jgi:hypothetical protein
MNEVIEKYIPTVEWFDEIENDYEIFEIFAAASRTRNDPA